MTYEYELLYIPRKENSNADALSRLPLPETPETTPVPGDIIYLMENLAITPVDATKVKQWTARDPVMSQVQQFVLHGWPSTVEDNALKPYFIRRNELSVCADASFGGRV